MSADPERAELDDAVLAWMREPAWDYDEARFDAIAREIFHYQYSHSEVYKRFCDGRGQTPGQVQTWREIPAVPTGAFKEMSRRCFDERATLHTFRTSGTSLTRRGELHLDTLALYEASLLSTFRRFLLPELTAEPAPDGTGNAARRYPICG